MGIYTTTNFRLKGGVFVCRCDCTSDDSEDIVKGLRKIVPDLPVIFTTGEPDKEGEFLNIKVIKGQLMLASDLLNAIISSNRQW